MPDPTLHDPQNDSVWRTAGAAIGALVSGLLAGGWFKKARIASRTGKRVSLEELCEELKRDMQNMIREEMQTQMESMNRRVESLELRQGDLKRELTRIIEEDHAEVTRLLTRQRDELTTAILRGRSPGSTV